MVFIALVIDILNIDLFFFHIITHLKALLMFLRSFYEVWHCGITHRLFILKCLSRIFITRDYLQKTPY